MNGRNTVTLEVAGTRHRVRFEGAGAEAGLPPFVGAFTVTPAEGGEGRDLRVALGLDFLWSADVAMDADEAADRIMRTVGLLCVRAHLAGDLEADNDGTLQVRDFIGDGYPDYTSVEKFVGSLYDPPGRIERFCREDLLRCLSAHADEKGSEDEPTGPGLTVARFLAWPEKRRFYASETVRDAVLEWETEGLVETLADRFRLRPDRLDDARALLE
ncbi:MAG: hypothetical protein R6X20_14280 [Phycisphaerae bacterium]